MKRSMLKIVCVILIGSFSLFFIISCSGMKNYLGWPKFLGKGEKRDKLTEREMRQFASGLRSYRGNPDSHYLLACYYQEREKHQEALEEFRKVALIDPNYVMAYNGMGVSYDRLGDFSRAIQSYQKALDLDPNLDYVLNNLGYSYLLQGNFDDAISAFKRAIALGGQDRRFHNNLGLAYAEKGEFDLALAEFKRASDDATAYYNVARVYLKKGNYHEAKDYFMKALGYNPSSTLIRTGLEAASSLSRIFQSTPQKEERGERIIPVLMSTEVIQPIEQPTKAEGLLGSDPPLAAVDARVEEKKVEDQRPDIPDRLPEQAPVALDPTPPPVTSSDATPASKPAQVAIGSYEVWVGSYRSPKIANSTASLLQGWGLRTITRDWTDETGGRWIRLFTGPFQTKEEAITSKKWIAGQYPLNAMIVKSRSTKTEIEEQKKSFAGIEISNGNGVNQMARKVSHYLKEKGFRVTRLTNANHFNHAKTKILYEKEYREAAGSVAEQLPVPHSFEEVKRLDRPNVKIKVLIGKDLVPQLDVFDNNKPPLAKKES